jgi:hypothetical protein
MTRPAQSALLALPLTALLAGCRLLAPTGGGDPWRDAVSIVAAGDIADCTRVPAAVSGAARTAELVADDDAIVLTVGDNTYPVGAPAKFADCFEPTWGRFGARLRPSPGNHDYQTPGAAGYYAYFGERAGPAQRGFYSFDVGRWHIVSLNSSVDARAGSVQHRWLQADLRASTLPCTLAVWHHPVFSSGPHGNDPRMRDALHALHGAGTDVVLVAHDHVYERLLPHDADGAQDAERGIRTFTVGTGGAVLYRFKTVHPLSEARDASIHGLLRLALADGRYRWAFVGIDGVQRDAGEGVCHPKR